jgi:hypothetical protein
VPAHVPAWEVSSKRLETNATAAPRRQFEKSGLAQHGLFDTDFPIAADRERLFRLRLAGVPTQPSDAVLCRYLEHGGSATMSAQARHDVKMRREHIAIADKFLAGGQLPPSLALSMLQDLDWRGALQETKEGLAAAMLPFLTFFLRRFLAGMR